MIIKENNPSLLSGTTLAFLGDSVYGLAVRAKLCEKDRPSGELHRLSVKLVNANAQARAFEVIKDSLTEKEIEIFKRGRNAHTSTTPKSSTNALYHTATGLEAMFGYLYLDNQIDRIDELFTLIFEKFSEDSFNEEKQGAENCN